jgi:hypothetical protein
MAMPRIPVGLPSTLLERRPDVAAAERNVAAAQRAHRRGQGGEISVARPDGTYGSRAANVGDLFTVPSRLWSIGAAAVQPLFDAGLRSAQTDQAIAAYDEDVALYRQAVLTAFQEVEDNLAPCASSSRRRRCRKRWCAAAAHVELTNNQYQAGVVSFINVIVAQTTLLANERSAPTSSPPLTASVQLVKALGGGWSTRRDAGHSALDFPACEDLPRAARRRSARPAARRRASCLAQEGRAPGAPRRPSRGAYVLKKAPPRRPSPAGRRKTERRKFGAGSVFGEMALIERGTAPPPSRHREPRRLVHRARRLPITRRAARPRRPARPARPDLVLSDNCASSTSRCSTSPPRGQAGAQSERRRSARRAKRAKKASFDFKPFLPHLRSSKASTPPRSTKSSPSPASSSCRAGRKSSPRPTFAACFIVPCGAVKSAPTTGARAPHGRPRPRQLLGYMSALEKASRLRCRRSRRRAAARDSRQGL